MQIDYRTGATKLNLDIVGRGDAFGDFASQPPARIASVNASFQLTGTSFGTTTLSGTNGFSGQIGGILVGDDKNISSFGGSAAVFTFVLRNAAGDVIFGVIVAEVGLI